MVKRNIIKIHFYFNDDTFNIIKIYFYLFQVRKLKFLCSSLFDFHRNVCITYIFIFFTCYNIKIKLLLHLISLLDNFILHTIY